MNKRQLFKRCAAVLAGFVLVLTLCKPLLLPLVPLPQGLFAPPPRQMDILDRNGETLRQARDAGAPVEERLPLADIPQPLINATLAAEDVRFWSHHGIDWAADLRAAWQMIWNRRIISGASTISQQLIKLNDPRPRTFRAKLIESLQAMRLEQIWDKQRILAEYLNRLDYGNNNRGCAAAAQFYFAKPVSDLSIAECALLAGLPQSPARLNPRAHFARARRRQGWILVRMRDAGWLTDSEYRRAAREPLRLSHGGRPFQAPHFVDLLLERNPSIAGGTIHSALDLPLNRFAEQTLRGHLESLRADHVGNGAVVIIENKTGGVLALAGSVDYFSENAGQVNCTWTPRSTGSALKPFLYWLAFEHGATPATVTADVPSEFATSTGLFAPVNYDRHCAGPVRYRIALANSLNIPAVKVLDSMGGPTPLLNRLTDCGLSTLTNSPAHYGLGLAIGNADARLLELANAYACLARLGKWLPYNLESDTPPEAASKRIGNADAAYLIADILSDNDARTMAFGPESPLRFEFPVACKTGTSSDFRDNWAFGYTPEFTVGVWVGNPDGSPMGHVSGVTGAAPILHDLFEHLHSQYGTSWFAAPADIVERTVDPVTGCLSARRDAVKEKFIADTIPRKETSRDCDAAGRVYLGAEYRDWLASADNCLGSRAIICGADQHFRISFPPPGTVVFVDADLPDQGRRLFLSAEGAMDAEWSSDTLKLRREDGRTVAWLTAGRHELTARDPRTGATQKTWIEVTDQ